MTNEELAISINAGNLSLLEQLWDQCYGYIKKKAIKWSVAFQRADIEADDLIQCGYIAMCAAVKRFEGGRGSFICVLDYTLNTEFQKACGVRTSKKDPINNALRLEAPVGSNSEDLILLDTLEAEVDYIGEKENEIFKEQLAEIVRGAISRLPDKKRKAIEDHYFRGMTYSEIALEMYISNARAGQLVYDSLKALRTGKDSKCLFDLWFDNAKNPYKGTGLQAWKHGGSIEERMLEKKERLRQRYKYLDIYL